jgi:ABC-type sugar transport system ATPase subunit
MGDAVLEVRNIVKEFPGVRALDGMSLSVSKGEIRAIMGENGAGKSTLCNIITGLYGATSGDIFFKGDKIAFSHPSEALAVGIRMVYQERNLIGFLTGAQSICLGLEDRKFKIFTDEKTMRRRTLEILEEMGANVSIDVPVGELSPAHQQMIEIMRAVAHRPELLILDEPTAALGNEEVEMLFSVMRKLRERGVAIIIITHKLEEVFEISDSISILRNGQHIITVKNGEIDRMEVVRHMIGRDIAEQYPEVVACFRENKCLEVKNLADLSGKATNVSFDVYEGEVLGLYGLLGSGRTEVMRAILGLDRIKYGDIFLGGRKMKDMTPTAAIRNGIVLIPEDRRNNSIFRQFITLKHNVTLGYVDRFSNSAGLLNSFDEDKVFDEIVNYPGLRVKYADKDQDIGDLSGGNQQKVVLGRWIFKDNIKLVMLDEPTQGIDVGVKHDIYVLIRSLAARGISVLMVSSELPELTGVCDRIAVIRDGEVKGTLNYDEFDNERILEMVL